jgi:hypothetical protein
VDQRALAGIESLTQLPVDWNERLARLDRSMPFPMSREELEAVDVSLGGCLDEMDARAMAPLLPYIY